jgi:tetratricopeptide (TPR) repeat protein
VGKLLDLSFSRLHPEWLQVLLWRLSVLRGSFGLKMAQAMVSEVLDLAQVRQLARWSFVQEQKVAEEWRFEFLPLIGRYLQLRAREKGEDLSGHQRAIKYFSEHIQDWDGEIASCAEELEIFHHQCEQGEYQLSKQVMDGCFNQLNLAGYSQELVKVYERLTSEWIDPVDDERFNLCSAWTSLGNLYANIGQLRQSVTAHQEALELSAQIYSAEGIATSLGNLGGVYHSLGEYPLAIELCQQSLDTHREIGDREGEASSLIGLGSAHNSLGDYQQALNFYQQSLTITQERGYRNNEANSLGGLGDCYYSVGKYQRALDFYQQSLDLLRKYHKIVCSKDKLSS